jgi:subtilisin family serine protease
VSPAAAAPANSKLDSTLNNRARAAQGRSRIIVTGQNDACLERVLASVGAVRGRKLSSLRGQVAEIADKDLNRAAGDSCTTGIFVDREVSGLMERTTGAIGARLVWEQLGYTGAGIGVAVIDSGVTSWHDDLGLTAPSPAPSQDTITSGGSLTGGKLVDAAPMVMVPDGWLGGPVPLDPSMPYAPVGAQRVIHFVDFVNGQSSVYDDYGHGTHVAGIIAGNGYDSNGARSGIAPEASIIALKVLDAQGNGYISNVIAAIDYAVAHKNDLNIRVINLSVGAKIDVSYKTDPLALAAKRAVDAGIVVVAAAGNLGKNAQGQFQYGGITAPGNAPWVLTVGAASHRGTLTRSDETMASFSSHGPTYLDWSAKPDLVAPGVGIESLADASSLFYTNYSPYLLPGTVPTATLPYLSLSGTSMSAPVVAGTVALMLQANPALTPNAVKAILQYTAEVKAGYNFLTQGAGFLNARGAVRLAQYFANPDQSVQFPLYDSINNETTTWGRQLIWGSYRISGGIITPNANAWAAGLNWGSFVTATGANIVWGSTLGDNIVWGSNGLDNIVWGSSSLADNIVWGSNGLDNIVWGSNGLDNIVWGSGIHENIVWGSDCGGANCDNIVWGSNGLDNIVWGSAQPGDNIVWSSNDADNVVWGSTVIDNIVWGSGISPLATILTPPPAMPTPTPTPSAPPTVTVTPAPTPSAPPTVTTPPVTPAPVTPTRPSSSNRGKK